MYDICLSNKFENFTLIIIILNSIKLALDTYFNKDSAES